MQSNVSNMKAEITDGGAITDIHWMQYSLFFSRRLNNKRPFHAIEFEQQYKEINFWVALLFGLAK